MTFDLEKVQAAIEEAVDPNDDCVDEGEVGRP